MTADATVGPPIPGLRHVRLISSAGGFGDVHLYEDLELGRSVAVKVIREADLSPTTVQRFMAEANAMAALEHPNIVRVYGAGTATDGRPYISMQYCPQATLEAKAARERLGVAEVLRAGIGIGSAIETAHRAGLLHRDIKPANILTTPWGSPGLTDFGVAAQISAEDETDDDVGVSVPWSPPEMLYSTTRGTPASDVYSLGATVWHLLVGRSPFEIPQGDNRRLALMGRVRDLPVPPTGRPDVPESLERLLRYAMAKRPEQRPQTMAQFVGMLQGIESELGLPRTEAVYVEHQAHGGAIPPQGPPRLVSDPKATPTGAEGRATQLRPRASSGATGAGAATQLRPKVTEIIMPAAADPAPSTRSVRTLTVVGLGLLVVAAIAGYWLVDRGHGAAPTQPAVGASTSSAEAGTGAVVDDTIPPGPVTVTGARSSDGAVFTWSYSAALSTDTYRWEVVGGASGVASKPTVTVPDAAGTKLCLHVIVVRADGSYATKDWSTQACVG